MKLKKKTAARPTKGVSPPHKAHLRLLPTGVRGLDEILGGGLPEYSFNIIAGEPGCGKTTMAHQFIFANATRQKPALYFTVLGEPTLKMLRYQQQYSFFDPEKLNGAIRFINLSEVVLAKNLDGVLNAISQEVKDSDAGIVVVDSFRTVVRKALGRTNQETELQSFIQNLALFLANWQATTFLVGEYSDAEVRDNPVFTVADGILWLSQVAERNSVVRKLQVKKLRGQASVPGLHTIRISNDGVQAFSRTLGLDFKKPKAKRRRLSIGVPELDKMMGGGILEGDSLLIAGPSGTGKSALATQFLAEGVRRGETAIAAIFEERPQGYTARADNFGLQLNAAQKTGKLELLYLRPLDLSVDETMQAILDAVKRLKAKRLVIDSLVGFEMALAPGFRMDFRESLYRMIAALTGAGVTILTTVEIEDTFTSLELSHYTISFLTDDIVRLRYVEIAGQMRKVMMVIKMRGGDHSKDIREYVITRKGVVLIEPRPARYHKLTTGLPERIDAGETGPTPKGGMI